YFLCRDNVDSKSRPFFHSTGLLDVGTLLSNECSWFQKQRQFSYNSRKNNSNWSPGSGLRDARWFESPLGGIYFIDFDQFMGPMPIQHRGESVTLNEQICMPQNFCFNREYVVLIKKQIFPQHEKTSRECDLQFPITLAQMTIEKTNSNDNLNPISINMTSPSILRERLQALRVAVEFDGMVQAGIWRVDHTCWKKNNRSLKECGTQLFLHSELMNHTIEILRVENWILEPVETFGGTMRSFYIHFSPHFFLSGIQPLLDRCCYRDIHIEGTKWANVSVANQTELKSLFVKHTSNFNLGGNKLLF
ncbi:hypothetical protein C0J52_02073, partial [Blattella germanica]